MKRLQIAYNKSPRNEKIRYIVIHDTANRSPGADAMAHFRYFNGGDRNSSADFFVDEDGVLCVNDYRKFYTWHCGDGKGKHDISNRNSIGIEICVNADGNYEKALAHTEKLVQMLMQELNVPAQNVVRHFDASGKKCPASLSENNWSRWNTFHASIQGALLVQADEIAWELNHMYFPITEYDAFIKALSKAKEENSPLYWGYYKLANKIKQ